jgi:rare lipoprotein A
MYPQLSSASAVTVEENLMASDAIADNVINRPDVDAAPDRPLTSDELAQLPDAVPVDEPLSKYGNVSPYRVLGETYTVMAKAKNFKQAGTASWYGKKFHGQRTSSGEPFDMFKMTAAHKNLPIPCYARVTNQENGKSVIVKVNDRGPFHAGRVMDVSWAAAAKLDMLGKGTAKITIEVVKPAASSDTVIVQNDTPASQPAAPSTQFFVQVGAFGTVDNALSLQSKLSSIVPLPIEISDATEPTPVHKVQIGPFVDEASAEKARNYLLQVAAINPIIVKR